MGTEEPRGADVSFEALGTKTNFRNVKSLNTVLTACTFAVLLFVAYLVFAHAGEGKDTAKEFIKEMRETNKEVIKALKDNNADLSIVLKELARGQREQNCLLALEPTHRKENAQICKDLNPR